jgi:hypothetical protein
MIPANVIRATVVLATLFAVGLGAAPSMAQQATSDVAYVEAVSGRVVAAGRGNPVLVEALEVISEQTRFDLLPNSELRLCHYHMQRFLTVKGPARVTVSADGITVEAGKAAVVSQDTCGFELASKFQGGFVARGGRAAPSTDKGRH